MSVHPLTAFCNWGWAAPYDATIERFGFPAKVRPVEHEAALATTRRGGIVHMTSAVAVMTAGRRVQYGARWVCSGIGSNNAILVDDAAPYGGVCDWCADVAAGPWVYRCYAADGDLLYIGSTDSIISRFRHHRAMSRWWPELASVTKQAISEISLARAAEATAIHAEHPRYNVQHRDRIGWLPPVSEHAGIAS